jgi:hypothetical protein
VNSGAKLSTLRVDASGRKTKFNDIICCKIHHLPSLPQQPPAMALLVDKLRPRSLDTLTYHPELSNRLSSLVRPSPPSHTSNSPRPHPPTFPTSSSMALAAPAKRPASSAPCAPSTAPASKRSRSTPASSKLLHHVNSNSTLFPQSTISRSHPATSRTMIGS